MKAATWKEVKKLEDIPNVGKQVANDLRGLGISNPLQLQKKDSLKLYKALSKQSSGYVDPCMLDTFMAVIDFMNGAKPLPWWAYTSKRKKLYAHR